MNSAVQPAFSRFDKSKLPDAAQFWRAEFGSKLKRPSRGWAFTPCPFHQEKTASFHVNLTSGAFHCFGCQTKGGDVVDYLMQRDAVDFRTAAMRLGAWDSGDLTAAQRREMRLAEKERQRRKELQLKNECDLLSLRLAHRERLHGLERLKAKWAHLVWDDAFESELRTCEASYYLLAFGSETEQIHFLRVGEDERARLALDWAMTDRVTLAGGVL